MKKISVIAVLVALIAMVSGCDFIRSIAGRPTSQDLNAADSTVTEEADLEADTLKCGECSDTLECCSTLECPDTLACAQTDGCPDCAGTKTCPEEAEVCPQDSSCTVEAFEEGEEASDLDVEEPAPAVESAPAVEPEPAAVVEPKPLKNLSMVQISKKALGQKAALDYKYYVLIGTFAKKENLDRQVAKARKAGLEVEKITFSNGLVAVGVCPTDNFATAVSSLETLKKLDFCPKDAHIIVAE